MGEQRRSRTSVDALADHLPETLELGWELELLSEPCPAPGLLQQVGEVAESEYLGNLKGLCRRLGPSESRKGGDVTHFPPSNYSPWVLGGR